MENNKTNALDYNCARCEPMGRKRKATRFVGLNDLDAEYLTPLCNKCIVEWRIEMLMLLSGTDDL